jgi:pilus assembly protein CpaB
MNTKKIWITAIFAGLVAAVLVYSSVISSTTSSEREAEEALEQQAAEEAEQEEAMERGLTNPIDEIEEGMRAISLYINRSEEGVSGYIEPQSRVDIIAFTKPEDAEEEDNEDEEMEPELWHEELTAELLLQDVKVLAAGRAYDSDGDALRYEQVTVEVTPEDGVVLSLASKNRDGFYFMLRQEGDDSIVEEPVELTRPIMRGADQQ